jgi:hypothetical protein
VNSRTVGYGLGALIGALALYALWKRQGTEAAPAQVAGAIPGTASLSARSPLTTAASAARRITRTVSGPALEQDFAQVVSTGRAAATAAATSAAASAAKEGAALATQGAAAAFGAGLRTLFDSARAAGGDALGQVEAEAERSGVPYASSFLDDAGNVISSGMVSGIPDGLEGLATASTAQDLDAAAYVAEAWAEEQAFPDTWDLYDGSEWEQPAYEDVSSWEAEDYGLDVSPADTWAPDYEASLDW